MSDKNPFYSIPKALGEPTVEVDMLPPSQEAVLMIELRERMERMILEAFCPPAYRHRQRPTALVLRGNSFEVAELDDAGNVIERCRKCGPVLMCSDCMGKVA